MGPQTLTDKIRDAIAGFFFDMFILFSLNRSTDDYVADLMIMEVAQMDGDFFVESINEYLDQLKNEYPDQDKDTRERVKKILSKIAV